MSKELDNQTKNLRDEFAMRILPALIIANAINILKLGHSGLECEDLASDSYEFSDAMLEAGETTREAE